MQNKRSLKEEYSRLLEEYTELYKNNHRSVQYLSFLRLLVFVGGIVLAVFMFRLNNYAGFTSLIVSIIIFGVLLKLFARRSWQKEYHLNLTEVNRNEISSLNEDYSTFDEGLKYIDPSHSFSHDLDLFGKGSLYQSLNRTCTERGADKLAAWISNPYPLSTDLSRRNTAIKELSDSIDWRQKFSALAMMNKTSDSETRDFYDWMKEDSQFSGNRILRIALYVLPIIAILLLVLSIKGTIHYFLPVVAIVLNLGLVAANLRRLNTIHSKVSKKYNYLSVVNSLIQHIEEARFSAPYLVELQSDLGESSVTAVARVKKLAGILQAFDSRLNMIMGVILNGFLLWDFQCVVRIELWKKEVSHLVPAWFGCIETIDALSSLADYACNNPEYSYPEIITDSGFLETELMGHHLIKSDKRVCNDYKLSSYGSINIITGANMAGKSTFLRTLAINIVLAMSGAPVCAKKFRFTPVDLFTSMRTSDSLSEEESYFFAELKRLRMLIERIENEKELFFILDEILKGTNSKDKSEGSFAFIKKVIGMGGTGMVATHDISLGSLSNEFPEKVTNSCFEIEIDSGNVKFDYLLREGITTKMNAALLMKQQGII